MASKFYRRDIQNDGPKSNHVDVIYQLTSWYGISTHTPPQKKKRKKRHLKWWFGKCTSFQTWPIWVMLNFNKFQRNVHDRKFLPPWSFWLLTFQLVLIPNNPQTKFATCRFLECVWLCISNFGAATVQLNKLQTRFGRSAVIITKTNRYQLFEPTSPNPQHS